MIEYESGKYGVAFIFTCRGSVFPKALMWSMPAVGCCIVLHRIVDHNPNMSISQVWSAYNFILGFLVVFRSQQAYQRFWEGATILQQVRGEWFNAVSSCFAFCTAKKEKALEVSKFQHLLIRLASLLYCTALQQIAVLSDEAFEILELEGVDEASLEYLANAPEKCLVILQWIQRLIVQNTETGVLEVPPPILSRVYQELSRGIVNIVNAQKITDIVFPFPYAQMVTVMLITTTVITPYIMAVLIRDAAWSATLTFVSVFAYWCINYIAAEIEMPFGEDPNDLPIAHLQEGMNMALRMLLDDCSRNPPTYFSEPDRHGQAEAVKCPYQLITDVQHKMWGSCHRKLQRAEKQNRQKRMTQQRIAEIAGKKGGDCSQELRPSEFATASVFSNFYDADGIGRQSTISQGGGVEEEEDTEEDRLARLRAQKRATRAPPDNGPVVDGEQSRKPSSRQPSQANPSNDIDGSLQRESLAYSRTSSGKSSGKQNKQLKTSFKTSFKTASATFIEAESRVLPGHWELLDDRSKEWLPQNPLLLDRSLAGVIVRMQKHFLRISEDLTFITCHSSWPGTRAENERLPNTETAKLTASIEENCCSISRALGGLAVVLCMREVDGMQMPSWAHDAEGCTQPQLSAPAELHLNL